MIDLVVRTVASEELDRAQTMYSDWDYSGVLTTSETILLAEQAGQWLGMVRCTREEGVLMLRGMWVAPAMRGRSVGTRLLEAFIQHLKGQECYCIPHRYLTDFYGRGGFVEERSEAAPPFLRKRLASYRSDGGDVVLMRRRPKSGLKRRER